MILLSLWKPEGGSRPGSLSSHYQDHRLLGLAVTWLVSPMNEESKRPCHVTVELLRPFTSSLTNK